MCPLNRSVNVAAAMIFMMMVDTDYAGNDLYGEVCVCVCDEIAMCIFCATKAADETAAAPS